MTKSTSSEKTQGAGKGPGANAKRGEATATNTHLIVPVLDLGGDDEDGDDDNFRPARGFVPPTPAKSAAGTKAVVPPQQGEGGLASAAGEDSGGDPSSAAGDNPRSSLAVGDGATKETPKPVDPPALLAESALPANDAVSDGQRGGTPASPPSDLPVDLPLRAEHVQGGHTELSAELATVDRQDAPAVRNSTSLSGLPARRPGRRRSAEPFKPEQPRQRNEQAMLELARQAPGYASLLTVYSASQLNALSFENRNINLYGLAADQVGTQRTGDMALLKTLTLQRPKLTLAHYVDAALEPLLRPLDPEGIDIDAMEDERDYVWQLAQKGLAYRRYILSHPDSASMDNYRPVCSLRADVNARLTRMMDLMDSIQGIQAKPFEIVSGCLAEFVGSLPTERPHVTQFFQNHLVTTVQ